MFSSVLSVKDAMPQIGRIFALLGVEHLAEAALGSGGVLRLTLRRLPHLG